MQAFRALIAASPAVRSLPFVRAMATRTFAALGPKAGAPPTPAAPAAAAKPAAATLAAKASSGKPAGPFASLFGRKSAPRKMKAAPAKKKNAAGKVLVKRKSKFSIVLSRKPKVAAKASRSVHAHAHAPPPSTSPHRAHRLLLPSAPLSLSREPSRPSLRLRPLAATSLPAPRARRPPSACPMTRCACQALSFFATSSTS